MIIVNNVQKTFKLPIVKEGRFAGIRSLFTRGYTEKIAVQNVNFTIEQGDFVGYIGPNGAGKSTTIKMLTGILHPSAGEITIHGLSPQRDRRQVVQRLGVVFGQRSQLWWDLPTKDTYDILAAMYGIGEDVKKKRLGELSELLGLDEFLTTPARKLSLGQRMRADLAAALLHDPDILFLDEPTIGLDVTAKKNIRGFLHTLNQDLGKTILLTTHDMDDIEQLCKRVIVIESGRISYDGSIDSLRDQIGLPTIMRVSFVGQVHVPKWTASEFPFEIKEYGSDYLMIHCNRQEIKPMDVLRIVSDWGEMDDVHLKEPDFEEIIHRIQAQPVKKMLYA
ncbi:ATP-binding cassette domain-containing protein [Paenibacillus sp. N1-5-1-14]|uniref:ABC transporter ATP-binding protein n=1 Tax=Paenibacillus radicibacter TaxID=2972488 RepID=UPI002158E6A3|nr:ATP-binding cassette domain-containing protein [Paenibacillus radicibacter]MCR8642482.1 ATP-binding cassette domain-containing protein [Paenibacillus radicibacter]